MNALCASIMAVQFLAVSAWLAALAAGRRLLGEYRAICAAAALAAALAPALSLAAPLVPSASRPAAAPERTAPAADPAAQGGAYAEAASAGAASSARLETGTRADLASLAGRAALGLSAAGALLFGFRLARYGRWTRAARDRSVPAGRENGVEFRRWDGPACSFGLFRPVVLLPEGSGRAAAMRLHEAAHVELGHARWNFLQAMLADLFWFNPAFRAIERAGREARELEADEAAIRGMGRAAYAECLVAEAQARTPAGCPAMASLWRSGLPERIKSIFEGRKRTSRLALASLAAAALLCAGASSPLAAAEGAAARDASSPAAAPGAGGARLLAGPCRVIGSSGAVKATQLFGQAVDPIDGSAFFHEGIDLTVPGEPRAAILAWDAGRVSRSGFDVVYGNYVEIVHSGGYVTLYAKLSARSVAAGDGVARGQAIGVMGSTGRSTGPHLHFAISKDGAKMDPSPLL